MVRILIALSLAWIFAGAALADPPPASDTGTTSDPNRIMPDTGWWYAANEAGGRGYSVEVNLNKGNAFIAAYVYNDNGVGTWYVATLTAQPTTVISRGIYGPYTITTDLTGTLAAYTGGQSLTGAFKPATSTNVGTVTLTFSSATQGRITWPASITPRQTTITRYAFTSAGTAGAPQKAVTGVLPQSGWWYNPAEGGRGYFFEVQGNQVFFAAFLYRPDGTAGWYVAGPVALTGNNAFSGNLTEVSNGPTFANPASANLTSTTIGSVSATFSSATAGQLSFNGGTPFAIQRFTTF